ncbi:hypothetical protein [Streptomyces sp. NBC_00057]|uniref:hypothetical protein n=1 Tax=Streptomyces sp. NBC_00057 TaxID=2975634 RepID=UPI0038641AF7
MLINAALVADLASGSATLALTDRNTATGVVRFAKTATAAGIRPVLGIDLAVAPHSPARRGSAERWRTPVRGGSAAFRYSMVACVPEVIRASSWRSRSPLDVAFGCGPSVVGQDVGGVGEDQWHVVPDPFGEQGDSEVPVHHGFDAGEPAGGVFRDRGMTK